MSAGKNRKEGRLDIRLLFIIVTMLEILGTVALSMLLAWLLEYFLHTRIQVHPLLWLLLFSIVIGVTVSIVVNILLLLPIVKLNRAMRKVAGGDFTIRLHTGSHITEIRDTYRNFNLMVKELGATETLQSDFVSNVSHEFKTPINAIEGYATLLQGTHADAQQQEYIERILLNTRRLSTLVGNILLLSKVSNHAIPVAKTAYRLDEQVRQAILLLEPRWAEKDIDFDVELEEITWTGNESLMLHVWSNLLLNAIKFDPPQGSIVLRLNRKDGQIVFTIQDTGPGIPEEEKTHIFNRFYQLDSSHKQEGNGLGLALCKQILDSCGGAIQVENVPEGGCRFTVSLPDEA
ncbi:MAG: HAMP domain-containing histidine kinase [Christensenellaceae bacterium]|nr:HAMP domain-containing histidine kinase [Christensenellaceae bacterium]